jgi:hypothetical protein
MEYPDLTKEDHEFLNNVGVWSLKPKLREQVYGVYLKLVHEGKFRDEIQANIIKNIQFYINMNNSHEDDDGDEHDHDDEHDDEHDDVVEANDFEPMKIVVKDPKMNEYIITPVFKDTHVAYLKQSLAQRLHVPDGKVIMLMYNKQNLKDNSVIGDIDYKPGSSISLVFNKKGHKGGRSMKRRCMKRTKKQNANRMKVKKNKTVSR